MSDELVIDEGFRTLLIPLTSEERSLLEQQIKDDGCRDALVAWPQTGGRSILVDGHNRYEICTRLGKPFKVAYQPFESREDVELWIIRNQLGRRNLESYVRCEYVDRCAGLIAEQAKQRQRESGGDKKSEAARAEQSVVQKSSQPIQAPKTRDVLAKMAGVSHDTLRKARTVRERAIPEVIEKARTGEISINKAAAVASVPAEEQPAMLAKVTAPKEPKAKPTTVIDTPKHKMICITLDPKRAATEMMMNLSKTFLNKLIDELLELRNGGRL